MPDPLEAMRETALVPLLDRDPAVQAVTLLRQAQVLACDMTNAEQCDAAIAAVVAHFGCIHILVNVAGRSGPIGKTDAETTPEEFDEIVTLNMNGCFHMMRAGVPGMPRSSSMSAGVAKVSGFLSAIPISDSAMRTAQATLHPAR